MVEALEDRAVPSTADILYVGDAGNNTVQRFDADTGASLGTFVDNSKSLKGPRGMIFDGDGHFLLANQNAGRGKTGEIMRYDAGTGVFQGSVVPFQDANAPFAPRGMVLKDGIIYVANLQDSDTLKSGIAPNGSIRRYDASTGAYLGNLTPPTGLTGQFNPRGIVFGPDGKLYVAVFDSSNPAAGYVLRFNLKAGMSSIFAFN